MRSRTRTATLLAITTIACLIAFSLAPVAAHAGRVTLSLDGKWQIADSLTADTIPQKLNHQVPVPGLANLAQPPFDKVDAFYSREHLAIRIQAKLTPEKWLTNYWQGKVLQGRMVPDLRRSGN